MRARYCPRTGPTIFTLVGAVALLAWWTSPTLAVDTYFAGSAQLDYLYVPTRGEARDITFDGFTNELSLKFNVDVNDHLGFAIKTCYGCHGFEMGMAYMDYRVADELTIRVGRFTPAFGDFPDRHDPANHRTSDKPLPYDMGRMMRLREWNMSVLPAPYVDNGIELRGRFALSDTVDLDYAAYIIGGLRGGNDATDVDFIQSRSPALYFVDNNSRPSVGGRLAVSMLMGDSASLKIGASGHWGTYDPRNELEYLILGADLVLKVERWVLRAEYLIRRTEMSLGDSPEERFLYGPGGNGEFDSFSLKEGWYVETRYPVIKSLDIIARFDGMRRRGNVVPTSALRSDSVVLRYTLGAAWAVIPAFRIKLSGEFYDFSDFDDEVGVHVGVVGAF